MERVNPKIVKGALISFPEFSGAASWWSAGLPKAVVFQFNPTSMKRTVKPRFAGERSDYFEGAPNETINFKAIFDATVYLAEGDDVAASMGLHPQLSALETMVYPSVIKQIADTIQVWAGVTELSPSEPPSVLFIWGKRIVPVRLSSFVILEKNYNNALDPVYAEVTIDLKVLNYSDLPIDRASYYIFLAQHIFKEGMAAASMKDLKSFAENYPGIIP